MSDFTDLRALLGQWDPFGVRDDESASEDEYDCLTAMTLRHLRKGRDADHLARALAEHIDEHTWGPSGRAPSASERGFARSLADWYRDLGPRPWSPPTEGPTPRKRARR